MNTQNNVPDEPAAGQGPRVTERHCDIAKSVLPTDDWEELVDSIAEKIAASEQARTTDLRAQLAAKTEALEILTRGYSAKTAEVERLRKTIQSVAECMEAHPRYNPDIAADKSRELAVNIGGDEASISEWASDLRAALAQPEGSAK